jgi:hypothetical protein
MKPSEKEVLDTLRKTTLAYLSESDYAEIEKAVEQEGILNLTGTASAIVKSAVQKHGGGSHDQASHGSWAGNGAGGGNDPGGYKAEAKRDDAKDEANSRDAKTKEQVLSSNRSDKKVSEIATRLSALSDKMRTKTSNPYTKDDNIKAADKVKAISEKLTEAASADTSSFRHFELTTQAYASINKLSSAIFSNAGAGASFDSITMQASNYLGKLDDDLYYMNKAGVQKHGGGTMSGDKTPGMTPFSGVSKATSVKTGDMVSWNSSGGSASGKVVRVISSGKINVPDSSFSIEGTEDDPAALIQLYRDGKPTETKVGHKVSTLKKKLEVSKHGSHDQSSHGAWANGKYNPDDSEGEDALEPKNYGKPTPKLHSHDDDSEGEFEELDADDPRWMDDMDIMRPSRITPSQRYTN